MPMRGSFKFPGGTNPIKHVIYIIKENRTYDQIFGDIKEANGDPSLTMYGRDITPNEHKLALQFGIYDNFYDSGEVSGNGHDWSTAAISTDYTEANWQVTYRGGSAPMISADRWRRNIRSSAAFRMWTPRKLDICG